MLSQPGAVPALRLSPGGTMHMESNASYEDDDEEVDVGSPVRSDSDHGIGSSEHNSTTDQSSDTGNQSEWNYSPPCKASFRSIHHHCLQNNCTFSIFPTTAAKLYYSNFTQKRQQFANNGFGRYLQPYSPHCRRHLHQLFWVRLILLWSNT